MVVVISTLEDVVSINGRMATSQLVKSHDQISPGKGEQRLTRSGKSKSEGEEA
jgi:hypothetical protein